MNLFSEVKPFAASLIAHGTHVFFSVGTPEARGSSPVESGEAVLGKGQRAPSPLAWAGLAEHCKLPQSEWGSGWSPDLKYILDMSLENTSIGRKYRYFLLITGSPAEPLDITGGTLRFRGTPVEKHWCTVHYEWKFYCTE